MGKQQKAILALAEELTELRALKSNLDEELKFVNGKIEKVNTALVEAMTESEMPNFTHSGFQYALSTRNFASATDGDKDSLYAVLRDNGFDHLFTVNAQTLTSTVRELMENNADTLPDWLDGKVSLYDKVSVRVTKK
jgi:uncharacterized coiled-coil protein SlyX